MTERTGKSGTIDVKAVLAGDEDFLRALVRPALQEVLEVEMTQALGAEKSERTAGRLGYRSGYHDRTLVTRIGKLELRVPQDRDGRFSTELFERYQRSERALVAALGRCMCKGFRPVKLSRSPRSCAATASRPPRSVRSISGWMRAWRNLPAVPWPKPSPI